MSAVRNKGLAQRLRMWWRDLAALFWPPVCPVCGRILPEGVPTVCMWCRMEAPLTGFWLQVDNPLVRKCWGLVPVVQASAFLFFVRGNGYRDLIHAFKYDGRWRLAREMGLWYGSEMARGGLYADVDVVVPVPLHLLKRLRRGTTRPTTLPAASGPGLACRWMDTRSAAGGITPVKPASRIASGGIMCATSLKCAIRNGCAANMCCWWMMFLLPEQLFFPVRRPFAGGSGCADQHRRAGRVAPSYRIGLIFDGRRDGSVRIPYIIQEGRRTVAVCRCPAAAFDACLQHADRQSVVNFGEKNLKKKCRKVCRQ